MRPQCFKWLPRVLIAFFSVACSSTWSRGSEPRQITDRDWSTYLGDKGRTLFSPLDQINRANVAQLTEAWRYDTGDKGEFQSNNLIINGVLYTASPTRKVIALNAADGRVIWEWDPSTAVKEKGRTRQRGLVFWQDAKGDDQRIFTGVGNHLYALDAKTGKLINSFGEDGAINLGAGLDVDRVPSVGLNTPGVIFRDLLILGGFGGPGAVRALDVRTGARQWIFHLIPRPGEPGYDTWPPGAYKTAEGLMPWCGQTLDEGRGIVYVATKTAAPDFYGGKREGENLYANCLVALEASTGRLLWYHQIVHHDLLDRDLPCAPVLISVTQHGKKIDAIVQGTKQGLLFVFDRTTGDPLWPIEEKTVPISALHGEKSWPTQPFPTVPEPLMRQHYEAKDVSPISPAARAATLARIQSSPNFGPFPAPDLHETVMFPGFDGGMEWGGGAADPAGVYYVNVNEIPWLMQMVETNSAKNDAVRGQKDYLLNCAACHGLDFAGNPQGGFPSLIDLANRRTTADVETILAHGAGRMPAFDGLPVPIRSGIVDYIFGRSVSASAGRPDEMPSGKALQSDPYAFAGFKRWQDQEGYPAIKPPWGTLNAVDLNTGKIKWKIPLGEYPELTARGIPITGTENYGGPVVTGGGLISLLPPRTKPSAPSIKKPGNCCGEPHCLLAAMPPPAPTWLRVGNTSRFQREVQSRAERREA